LKGIIFNVFEQLVARDRGEDAWDRLLEPVFAERYPGFFEPHQTTLEFLLTLNEIIHPEVRKLYPGAEVPVFDHSVSDHRLTMGYKSDRKLCMFAEGLIEGAAAHYEEELTVKQPTCMNRGDERCVLEISFRR
jgi:heme-NO-binding protein